ncbi:MAG TPA: response regulator [Dehalococcoidia bacterium]|nr:response regulator [Dehalococcoidia bacterium]
MAKNPSALIVDTDIQARFEAKQIVKASGLTIAGECGFGMEAVSSAQELRPDVVFLGVTEPIERPLQTVEALQSLMPDMPILVYSDTKELEFVRKAMMAGARDFLAKPIKPETLRQSVMMALEAEEKRKLRQLGQIPGAATAGTIITVFGAKGGIGKSTISTNLAVALAGAERSSVVIVDLDNGFGDIAGMLDIRPERTLFDMVRDLDMIERDDIERYVAKHELTNLDVLAGPTVLEWRKISPDHARRAVDFLASNYDTVILDTSGMLNELAEMAVEIATIVLWITTTEYASVKDSLEAMQALKMLSYSQERVRIVMNAISPDDGVRPSVVQDALQRDVFWNIPYDKKVRQGTHLGQPIVITAPQSIAAKSLSDLATVIAGGRVDRGGKLQLPGFKWRPAVAES